MTAESRTKNRGPLWRAYTPLFSCGETERRSSTHTLGQRSDPDLSTIDSSKADSKPLRHPRSTSSRRNSGERNHGRPWFPIYLKKNPEPPSKEERHDEESNREKAWTWEHCQGWRPEQKHPPNETVEQKTQRLG
ncbi:hypothetical protein DY000_02009495 [Brassica cretica]|uniref:Uncharacterized protein n=1 Tax=Brassica cretica TaxID=69181 RepID=A0ABQ7BYN8_BRACR|nr:hypothetical protein DY000_02009495 [Brassica cretica]